MQWQFRFILNALGLTIIYLVVLVGPKEEPGRGKGKFLLWTKGKKLDFTYCLKRFRRGYCRLLINDEREECNFEFEEFALRVFLLL